MNLMDPNRKMDPAVVARLFATFVGVGLLVVGVYGLLYVNPLGGMLWSGACLAAGALGGFLFGIPKTNPTESGAKSAEPSQNVNTNLEEISDWVTKIIVGLGLANLSKFPARLQLAAGYIAHTWNHSSDQYAMGYAVMLYFSVVGFLGGYLLTRIFLSPMFREADGTIPRVFSGGGPPTPLSPGPAGPTSGAMGATGSGGQTSSATPIAQADAAAAVLDAYTELEKKPPADVLQPHIKELEGFKEQFPGFRMLFIMLGRLYRWTGELDKAIQVLTEFIEYKTKIGFGGDADTGAAYYNRGCYEAVKSATVSNPQRENLSKLALSDISEAIKRESSTKGYALDDPDLGAIKDQIQRI